MADEGFDFHTPQRKEAKRFEPPPWEKEAFDELERRRAEEAHVRALMQAAQEEAAAAELAAERASEQAAEQGATVSAETIRSEEAAGDATAPPGQEGEPETGQTAIEDERVSRMLARLSEEEPRGHEGVWAVALGAALVLGAIGGVLIVWAMAAMVGAPRSGATGIAGGLVLLVFGAGFVFGALWLAYRTLRQRGVL